MMEWLLGNKYHTIVKLKPVRSRDGVLNSNVLMDYRHRYLGVTNIASRDQDLLIRGLISTLSRSLVVLKNRNFVNCEVKNNVPNKTNKYYFSYYMYIFFLITVISVKISPSQKNMCVRKFIYLICYVSKHSRLERGTIVREKFQCQQCSL